MLEGNTVNLRPIERSDLHNMVVWRNKSRVLRAFFSQRSLTMSEQERWYEEYCRREEDTLFIVETKEGKPIGTVGLSNIDPVNRSAEFGRLMIGEDDELGKSYASDATRTLVRFGFVELSLNRIWLEVFAWNQQAIILYGRCGFWQEGVKRQAILAGGVFHDVVLMSVLRDDLLGQKLGE
ncbi:MAG: GNAT family N-acetyltransferase [Chloroflexi bacterium]|nr:GNAT family N-acetyltransferase [Chloroflexota bacterium]MDA8189562.1 GNAT family protein [Dehalococcoidales bacterium]